MKLKRKRNIKNRLMTEREYMDRFHPADIRRKIVMLMLVTGTLK